MLFVELVPFTEDISYIIWHIPKQIYISIIHSAQARSQDQFLGGAGHPKCGPFDQKNGLSEPHPLNPLTKTPFLAHFVTKSGPFGRFGVVASHPPGYGRDSACLPFSCLSTLHESCQLKLQELPSLQLDMFTSWFTDWIWSLQGRKALLQHSLLFSSADFV